MDLFWLKELIHTQENEKKEWYATILTEKKTQTQPQKIHITPADQRKPAGSKPVLTVISSGNWEQKGLSRQPQLHLKE